MSEALSFVWGIIKMHRTVWNIEVSGIRLKHSTGADPGFPVGGRGPSAQALFGENYVIKTILLPWI